MLDGDRRLEDVAAGRSEAQRARRETRRLLAQARVPAAAVLVLEQHEGAAVVDAGVASRIVGEQQRE